MTSTIDNDIFSNNEVTTCIGYFGTTCKHLKFRKQGLVPVCGKYKVDLDVGAKRCRECLKNE
jgi:hypothetical protein